MIQRTLGLSKQVFYLLKINNFEVKKEVFMLQIKHSKSFFFSERQHRDKILGSNSHSLKLI